MKDMRPMTTCIIIILMMYLSFIGGMVYQRWFIKPTLSRIEKSFLNTLEHGGSITMNLSDGGKIEVSPNNQYSHEQ